MIDLTTSEKTALRTVALRMSREINPDTPNNQAGYGFTVSKTPPSVSKILTDAQTIYKWLLEGETNYEAGK